MGFAIGDTVDAITRQLPGHRQQMRELSVITALDALRRRLLDGAP
jgi:nicotinamide mononucleotide (NMN) deamidase PncC